MYLLPIIDVVSHVIGLWAALLFYRPALIFFGKIDEKSDTSISFDMYIGVSLIYIAILLIIFYLSKLYGEFKFSYRKFMLSVSYFVLISLSITYFMKVFAYSRMILAIMLAITAVMMLVWRYLLLRKIKFFLDKTLIVGIDDISKCLIEHEIILANEGKNVIGYVDIGQDYLGKSIDRFAVLGNIDNLKEIIKIEQVNSIIFSMKSISLSKVLVFRDMLEYNKVTYKILPDFIEIRGGEINYLNISQ
jgi:FlaA1/EpsC-like NDP-sugar epimerase